MITGILSWRARSTPTASSRRSMATTGTPRAFSRAATEVPIRPSPQTTTWCLGLPRTPPVIAASRALISTSTITAVIPADRISPKSWMITPPNRNGTGSWPRSPSPVAVDAVSAR